VEPSQGFTHGPAHELEPTFGSVGRVSSSATGARGPRTPDARTTAGAAQVLRVRHEENAPDTARAEAAPSCGRLLHASLEADEFGDDRVCRDPDRRASSARSSPSGGVSSGASPTGPGAAPALVVQHDAVGRAIEGVSAEHASGPGAAAGEHNYRVGGPTAAGVAVAPARDSRAV